MRDWSSSRVWFGDIGIQRAAHDKGETTEMRISDSMGSRVKESRSQGVEKSRNREVEKSITKKPVGREATLPSQPCVISRNLTSVAVAACVRSLQTLYRHSSEQNKWGGAPDLLDNNSCSDDNDTIDHPECALSSPSITYLAPPLSTDPGALPTAT